MAYAKTVGKLDLYNLAKRNGVAMRTLSKYGVLSNINAGLVGWWKFDETSGTSAADSSGNGKTATVYASPTWSVGQINNCLYLPGESGKFATATGVALTADFTVAFWVKSFGTAWQGTGSTFGFLSTQTSSDSNLGANGIRFDGASGGKGITANIRNGANNSELYVGGQEYVPSGAIDVWNHYAATFNNTTKVAKVYWNGVEGLSSTHGGFTRNASESRPVYIGHLYINHERNMKGWLDDVRIYNRALSADDISALYAVTAP